MPLVTRFLVRPVSPETTLEFERELAAATRELGRLVAEWSFNALEPAAPQQQPHDVQVQSQGFRRLRDRTPNRDVATQFGTITLWRRGYRSWSRDGGESLVFPLEYQLGLIEKMTPALAERIARRMAEAGATQAGTLAWLQCEHGVTCGAPRLRRLCEVVAAGLDARREEFQTRQLVGWLAEAEASSGRNRPVLAVGRDGVTFHVGGVVRSRFDGDNFGL